MTTPEVHGVLASYKGFAISVDPNGQFIGTDSEGEQIATAYTLSDLKSKLDSVSKKQIRMRVWIRTYGKVELGNLTSVKQSRGYGNSIEYEARVSYDKGSWNQVRPSEVYPSNPENDQLVKEYQALEDHANELHKASSEIMKKMKSINIQELLK